MSEAAQPAGIDYDKLATAMAAANKPLLDRLATLETSLTKAATPPPAAEVKTPPAAGAASATTAEKPFTLADLTKVLDERDQARQTTASATAARNAYIADKMKGLPPAYADKLPQTGDSAALAAAEQTIRAQFATDMKAIGVTVPTVSGAQPAAGTTAAAGAGAVDTSKMSGSELLALGIKQQGQAKAVTPGDLAALASISGPAGAKS